MSAGPGSALGREAICAAILDLVDRLDVDNEEAASCLVAAAEVLTEHPEKRFAQSLLSSCGGDLKKAALALAAALSASEATEAPEARWVS